jgi:GWxTD domain-containing protein
MNTRRILVAALTLAVAVSGFALNPDLTEWGKGPATYYFTKEEAAQWKNVKTDEEAQKFVALFFARRDPSVGTPRNEFRDEFEARVKAADERFNSRRKRGAMTDRGKTFVLLGPATRMQKNADETTRTNPLSPQDTVDDPGLREVWTWDGDRSLTLFGKNRVTVGFLDQNRTGDFRMDLDGGTTDVRKAQDRIVNASIKQPDLKEAPVFAANAGGAPAAANAPVAAPAAPAASAALSADLKSVIDEYRADKIKPAAATVYFYEMLSPSGEYFVAVQLYVPKSANVSADAVTTFFGSVEDASGATVTTFEEPAKLNSSKGDYYFDKSLTTLGPGSYKITFGLAGADKKPVAMASSNLELKGLDSAAQAVTPVVLVADVHETAEAAPGGAPFAFGKLKLVPKGDKVFTNKDELTYWMELLGFSLDEATQMPKVQIKLELSGKTTDGKTVPPIKAPYTEVAALPLTGAPGAGQYIVVSTIPLAEMTTPLPAGDYNLKVTVSDSVSKKTFTSDQSFKLIATK